MEMYGFCNCKLGWAKADGGFSSWQVFLVGENDVSCDTQLLGVLRRIGEQVDTHLLGAGISFKV